MIGTNIPSSIFHPQSVTRGILGLNDWSDFLNIMVTYLARILWNRKAASVGGSMYIIFADDTNIFVEGKTAAIAYEKGNQLLKLLYRYMISNKLHINMSKCCFIQFKPNKTKTFNDEGENYDLLIFSSL